MIRKRRRLLFLLTFLFLLVGLPAWWLNREIQHERENADLIAAVKRNDAPAVLILLANGADPNAHDNSPKTLAVREYLVHLWNRLCGKQTQNIDSNNPTALQLLFANHLVPYDTTHAEYLMPQNVVILSALLEQGANPNIRDADGKTPLLLATERRSVDYVRLLLLYRADVNARDRRGISPLQYAQDFTDMFLGSDMDQVIRLLKQHEAK